MSAGTRLRGTSEAAPQRRPGVGARLAGAAGWLLIGAGVVVLLYLVYSLFFTGLQTQAAQRELLEEFSAQVGQQSAGSAGQEGAAAPVPPQPVEDPAVSPTGGPANSEAPAATASQAEPAPVEVGDAVAAIEFVRPGDQGPPPVHDGPLLVVEGVTRRALMRGPGRYPGTVLPGQDGNFAVAGHRTTYGAPFFRLDQLREGDEVHVTDRAGAVHVYRFAEQRIVSPYDVGVLEADPLGSGAPTLTLTTCHPRFSAAQRMVVFAELVT